MRSLSLPEIIAIGVWLGVVNPNLGEEEVVGGCGWYHSKEHWLFVLQRATFPHPPLVSPKFLHVPLGVAG